MSDEALLDAFFTSGSVTGDPKVRGSPEERLAFVKAHVKEPEFKRRAWPHVVAFVDASNVARWDRPAVHEVTRDKAQVRWLLAMEEALRKRAYVPVMVSDANLVHLLDEPWTFTKRWGEYPHVATTGRKADVVLLRALRDLPDAVGVSRDRFMSEDEQREFPDVLADRSRFYSYRFDEAGVPEISNAEGPLPNAWRRLATRLGR